MKFLNSYIVGLQFLGFRFSGWQKQTNAKTIHDIVDKSLSFVMHEGAYKTIGMSRTDAKVSANSYYFQLFTNELLAEKHFLKDLNANFPQDYKALSIRKVEPTFNIINCLKVKEYHYYFSFGEKIHPFSAPFMIGMLDDLDIEKMKIGANLFEGEHYFHKYCTKPSGNTILKRRLEVCVIEENNILTASFFPKKSYVLKVKGKGFLRYQIRLIMATLIELGKGNLDLDFIEGSLKEGNDRKFMRNIAPGSGLQLFNVDIEL